jgi:hypothetical protein
LSENKEKTLTPEERLEIISEQHWQYTEKVIILALNLSKTLYKEAFKHGVKHAQEGRV